MKSKIPKVIYLSVIVLITLSSCSEKSSYNKFNLKGKVKTYSESVCKPINIKSEWQSESILTKSKYFFDENGMNTGIEFYFGNGDLFSKSNYFYKSGKISEEKNYDKSGKELYITSFTHNNDNQSSFKRIIHSGEKVTEGNNYYKNDKIIKSIVSMFSKGLEVDKLTTAIQYDEDGNIKSKTTSNKSGNSETIHYKYLEFDKKGNWTKCIISGEHDIQNPSNLLLREYEYYE
jgi:hypothetical protein